MWFLRRDRASEEESIQALKDAEKRVLEVTERASEIKTLTRALRDLRERNHFAEQVEEIILRRRGSTQ